MEQVDLLIVGAGLFGSVIAHQAHQSGKKVLVIDKRDHIGGNCYTKKIEGIDVHRYGAHIFHTSDKEVWDYINQFGEFNPFVNSPIAVVDGVTYNLPFNMNTFSKLFNVVYPKEVMEIIEREQKEIKREPMNLEEQAIKLVGRTVYEKLIKGYTEKQWGRKCTDLPPEIIKRLPVRLTYDNNYFNDTYQGIPDKGYTELFNGMLKGIEVRLSTPYNALESHVEAKMIVYTGMIDEYFDFCFGKLEYRSLRFEDFIENSVNSQGVAVMNYPSEKVPYTRVIEHRHFNKNNVSDKTVVTKEYSVEYNGDEDPYYPIGLDKNNEIYKKYEELAKKNPKIIFGGRLGNYKYSDMDDIIRSALDTSKIILR